MRRRRLVLMEKFWNLSFFITSKFHPCLNQSLSLSLLVSLLPGRQERKFCIIFGKSADGVANYNTIFRTRRLFIIMASSCYEFSPKIKLLELVCAWQSTGFLNDSLLQPVLMATDSESATRCIQIRGWQEEGWDSKEHISISGLFARLFFTTARGELCSTQSFIQAWPGLMCGRTHRCKGRCKRIRNQTGV